MNLVERLRLQAEDLHVLNPSSETVKCLSLGADRIEALEKQRDELLAALEWAADVLPPSDPYGMGVCDCPVCRAIESVKGGAA